MALVASSNLSMSCYFAPAVFGAGKLRTIRETAAGLHYGKAGQSAVRSDGDLSGFALATHPSPLLDLTSEQGARLGTEALHRRLPPSSQVDSTSGEQNLKTPHGKEGFLAQVKHEMNSGEGHEPLGLKRHALSAE